MARFQSGLALGALIMFASCIPEPERVDVPLTTSSPAARSAYVEGRELAENLRLTDARERFEAAVDEDPNFAAAHLALANSSATAGEFFEHMKRATELAEAASDGERWMIEAARAGLEGDAKRQREQLNLLLEAYPRDPRVHALLGGFYFGQQSYKRTIWNLEHAISIDAEFAPPYNLLGYALRFEGRFDEAEEAFRRYVELIPGEPNPYDSYAELLMKLGRFEDSIAQYRKALEQDPEFSASFLGIALNQLFLGRTDDARRTLSGMLDESATLGQRRQALTGLAVHEIHLGNVDPAVEHLVARRELAAELGDHATVSGDEFAIGTVLIEFGKHDRARARLDAATEAMRRADVPEEVRQAAARTRMYLDTRAALARDDLETAKSAIAQLAEATPKSAAEFESLRIRELKGAIALSEGDHATAARTLGAADAQNPRIRYMLVLAKRGLGETEGVRELCESVAGFNGLGMDYAFVRGKAQELVAEL